MKLDVLITTAHPDDAEAAMGGTILKLIAEGKKVGIADFTRGELGTRGTPELRDAEAEEANRRMGLTTRVNLGFRDGFFLHDEPHLLKIVQVIRRYRPDIVFSNPPSDRHPDHGRAHAMVNDAAFLSGLTRIATLDENSEPQEAWRPKRIFHYIQSSQHTPQFIVDIADYWEGKCHVLQAYETQFHKQGCTRKDPQTIISSPGFWEHLESCARVMGRQIDSSHGEGFLSQYPLHVRNVMDLI